MGHVAKRVASKIRRDAIMTTGASWKSDDAGPNRIVRWAMQLSDAELAARGISMHKLKPIIVAKLREKAASYEDCMACAQKLTHLAYGMRNAPACPRETQEYLESVAGPLLVGSTCCLVCREPLDFEMFERARRGKAVLETSHKDPRLHTPENVGFAHRDCNIAQGSRNLSAFYEWIRGILRRVDASS